MITSNGFDVSTDGKKIYVKDAFTNSKTWRMHQATDWADPDTDWDRYWTKYLGIYRTESEKAVQEFWMALN